jgi:hypothetical protein
MTLPGLHAIEVNLEKASGFESLSQETCMDERSDCVGETRMDHNISPKQRKRAAEVDAAAYFFCETLFIPRRGEGSPFRDPSPLGPSGNRERVFFVGRCSGLINSSRSDIF